MYWLFYSFFYILCRFVGFFLIYLCVCSGCMQVCIGVCASGGQRRMLVVLVYHFLPYALETGFLSHCICLKAGKHQAPVILQFLLLTPRPLCHFTWALGIWTLVLMLVSQALLLAESPGLIASFYKFQSNFILACIFVAWLQIFRAFYNNFDTISAL